MPGNLGFNLGFGARASSLRPWFNGIPPAGTYTGGPVAALDYQGVLHPGALNVPTIEGGRWDAVNGVWTPYDTDGTLIYPAKTTRGQLDFLDADPLAFKRYLSVPASTNKVTCRKANPVDTTNITKTGDAAAILSVVDDEAALAAAGLSGICTSSKVYKLDNSGGTGKAYVLMSGFTGNTTPHSMFAYARCNTAGNIVLDFDDSLAEKQATTSYIKIERTNRTPSGANRRLAVGVGAGSIVYFTLPQLEEGAFATPPIFRDATGADPLTALTRDPTLCPLPTAGVLRGNNLGGRCQGIPRAAGQTGWAWNTYSDANNGLGLLVAPMGLTLRKRTGGTNTDCTLSYTHAAATPLQVDWYQAATGMGIRYRAWTGAAWSAWSDWTEVTTDAGKADAVIASTYQIGTRNALECFAGNVQFAKPVWSSTPKARVEALQ